MAAFLQFMMWNALQACTLALLVAAATKSLKLSAPVRHWLWLMVLFKLILPPVATHSIGLSGTCVRAVDAVRASVNTRAKQPKAIAVELPATMQSVANKIPDRDAESSALAIVAEKDPLDLGFTTQRLDLENQTLQAEVMQPVAGWVASDDSGAAAISQGRNRAPNPVPATRIRLAQREFVDEWLWPGLFWIWFAGAMCMGLLCVWDAWRIQALLRTAGSAPAEVAADCEKISHELGLGRVPPVRIVARSISPTVCAIGRLVVMLPAKIVTDCSRSLQRDVLAHELAHLKRRDHWCCWLELIVGCVYWWLPIWNWVQRKLRQAADEAADAWAVSLSGCRKKYAESLLETLELIVADRAVVPAWGPALGERDALARRLTMIMREPLSCRLSWPARLGVALLGLIVLPAAPQRLSAQDSKEPPAGVPTEDEIAAAIEAFDQDGQPGASRPRDARPDQPPPRDRRSDARAPESGPRDAQRPQPPQPPGGRDGQPQRGSERRLQELESKLDRLLQMLEARAWQPGGGPGPFGGGMRAQPGMATQPSQPGPERAADGIEQMLRGIELNPEQRERIEHAQRDLQAELQKIDAEQAHAMQEFQRHRAEIERRRAEVIRGALSPEQRERMDQRRPQGDRSRGGGGERGESQGAGRGDGRGTGRGDGSGQGRDERRMEGRGEGRGGPERPREGAEPRRERGPDQPDARGRTEPGRGEPGRDRPRDGDAPRRPEGERREGERRDGERREGERREGEQRKGERPREEAGLNAETFNFFVGMFR